MILQWMVYSIVVSALLGIGAAAGESLVRSCGRPGRWMWLAALSGSLALPLFSWWFPDLLSGSVLSHAWDDGARIVIGALTLGDLTTLEGDQGGWTLLDQMLLTIWLALSVSLALLVVWTTLRLLRERASWLPATVGGRSVLVSNDVGPAVVGLRKHEIVVPRWVLDLDEEERRLVVLHEAEHATSGDLVVLLGGLAAALLIPWNPSVWWQLRRLRLAVEADCDARVLRCGTDAFTYGVFLLNVGGRVRRPRVAALALSERKFPLLRRVEMMTNVARMSLARGAASIAVLSLSVTLACDTPTPPSPGYSESIPPAQQLAHEVAADRVYDEAEVDEAPRITARPQLEYPRDLQQAGAEGVVRLQLVVGADGAVESGSISITESTDERFNDTALEFAAQLGFRPGQRNGQPVKTLIRFPIQFSLFGGN